MKRFAVHLAVHLRVRKENLCWAALSDDLKHPAFFQFLDGLRCENHRGVQLAPCFLRLNDVIADGLVLDEQPCFIKQEDFECSQPFGASNFERSAMEDVEEQRFQHVRRVAPAAEVEGLKVRERQRVFGVVEQEPVLTFAGPPMQPLLHFADDLGEGR